MADTKTPGTIISRQRSALSSFLPRPFSAGGIAGGPLTAPGSGARLHGRPQRLFAAVVVLTCLAHSLTLTRSPPAWQDEVQIIDYGRTILPGSDRSHGVNWSDRHRPIELLNCIGPLIQETACRLSSTTMLGPRVAALLGAAAAAAVLRGWLVAAGVSPWIASTGGLAFLWDPLFASSYRGARVDSWCMAAILASLWCIRLAGRTGGGSRMPIAAGASIAAGALVWPSAIMLVPLVAYEMYDSFRHPPAGARDGSRGGSWSRGLRRSAVVAVSATVFMMLFLLPFAGRLGVMIGDLGEGIAAVAGKHAPAEAPWRKLAGNFLNCPVLPLAAIGGTIVVGRRTLLIPLAAALGLAMSSDPYAYRTVYLVPYFAYGFASAADSWSRTRAARNIYGNPFVWVSALLLSWSGGISIGVRTTVALLEWEQRDPDLALRAVDGLHAGEGARVLLDSWSLYYAVRSRRLVYWGPYDQRTDDEIARSLDYDFVIHDEHAGTHPLDATLRAAGYRRDVVTTVTGFAWTRARLPMASARYGPYVVYTSPRMPGGRESAGR